MVGAQHRAISAIHQCDSSERVPNSEAKSRGKAGEAGDLFGFLLRTAQA